MKSLILIRLLTFAMFTGLLFFPLNLNYVFAAETHSSLGESHEEAAGEEVPFDRPVEEIRKYIAPMNELEIHPCSDCHDEDWEVDRTVRELDEPHDERPGKFVNHDPENRWCLDCHSAKDRDKLRLLNGKLIEFNEYYRLCEQCHKRIYREWKMGVHGKRTGHWNGEKQWMHCSQCHNPHDPPFKAIKPEPAPRKPLNVWSVNAPEDNSSADAHH